MSDLTDLRAEVEALRDEADAGRRDAQAQVHQLWNQGGYLARMQVDRYQFEGRKWMHRADAYQTVLDLIVKHARKAS